MFQQSTLRLALMAAVLTLSWIAPQTARSQAVANAQMTGLVTDSTGAAVSGATVKMIETEKSVTHTTTIGGDGHYTFPNLPVGPYRLEVSMSGFKTYVQTGLVLQVGNAPAANVTLQVGEVSENIEVSAGAAMVQRQLR